MPPSNGRTSEDSTKPPHVHRDHSSTTHTIQTPLSGSSPSRTACTPAPPIENVPTEAKLASLVSTDVPSIATRPQSPRLHLKKRFSLVRTTLPDLSASAMALAASPVPSPAPAARAPAPPAPVRTPHPCSVGRSRNRVHSRHSPRLAAAASGTCAACALVDGRRESIPPPRTPRP